MSNKIKFILIVILLVSASILYWINTAPTWYLYHRNFGPIYSVGEFDELMLLVKDNVRLNFGENYPFNAEEARAIIEADPPCKLPDYVVEHDGVLFDKRNGNVIVTLDYIFSYNVDGWAWLWEESEINPSWSIVREWKDIKREFNYNLPKAKEAQLCLFGFTSRPIQIEG